MGKAVVSTGLGAEGLEVEHGKHLLLADAPGPLAHSIVQLLTDPARRSAIGSGAHQLVLERFSAETVARQFDAICRDTVDARLGGVGTHSRSSSAAGEFSQSAATWAATRD